MPREFANADSSYFDFGKLTGAHYKTITQPLYDVQDYPAEGGSLYFFANPVGTGNPVKSYADTNMELSSQLPYGQAFCIEKIRLQLMLDAESRGDERRFYSRGQFTFWIGAKRYLTGIPGELDPHEDPEIRIEFNTSGTQCEVHFGTGENDPLGLKLAPNNLLLIPNQNFGLSCYELPRLKNDARLKATLYGQLFRLLC